jgi:hypothetical protein
MVAFTAGAVLTAANLNTAFNALTFRAVTGTSDTLVLADNGGAVSYSNASAITATVPPFSSVAYANGTVIQLLNLGAGVVTVTAGVGVTLNGSVVTLAQNAGGTLIKTATNTWYFLPSASGGSGMDLITPTSVAGSGVTLSGGEVSMSAATGVNVNGCFTSNYQNYQIWFDALGSQDSTLLLRMRLAGSDNSASSYAYQQLDAASTSVTGSRGTAQTSMYFGYATTTRGWHFVNIFNPNLASATLVQSQTAFNVAGPNLTIFMGGHNVATAFDGFSIIVGAGNITGKLRVYGLRNS